MKRTILTIFILSLFACQTKEEKRKIEEERIRTSIESAQREADSLLEAEYQIFADSLWEIEYRMMLESDTSCLCVDTATY